MAAIILAILLVLVPGGYLEPEGNFKITSERDTYYPESDDWRQFWTIEGPVGAITKIQIKSPGCYLIDSGRWSWDYDTFPDHPVPRFHIGEHGSVWWKEGADWYPQWDPNPTPGKLQIYTMSRRTRPSGQGIMRIWTVTGEIESYKVTNHKCEIPDLYLPLMQIGVQ